MNKKKFFHSYLLPPKFRKYLSTELNFLGFQYYENEIALCLIYLKDFLTGKRSNQPKKRSKININDLFLHKFIHLNRINTFDFVSINLASSERIKLWSQHLLPNGEIVGEVNISDTYNYRTFKTEVNGLFCERIFGPLRSWTCQCQLYKGIRTPGKICEQCGVELTESRVRRHRMGYIDLVYPVFHIWYLKGLPSYLSILTSLPISVLDHFLYFKPEKTKNSNNIEGFEKENIKKSLEAESFFIKFFEEKKLEKIKKLTEKKNKILSILTERIKKIKNKEKQKKFQNIFLILLNKIEEETAIKIYEIEEETTIKIQKVKRKDDDAYQTPTRLKSPSLKNENSFSSTSLNNIISSTQINSTSAQTNNIKNSDFEAQLREMDAQPIEDIIEQLNEDYKVHKQVFGILDELKKNEARNKKISNSSDPTEFLSNYEKRELLNQINQTSTYTSPNEILKEFLEDLGENLEQEIRQVQNYISKTLEELEFESLEFNSYEDEKNLQKIRKKKQILEKKEIRRLRLLKSLYKANINPAWIMITALPVLPPEIRPMIELDGGKLVSADLNIFYRAIIQRNNRLADIIIGQGAPELVLQSEKKLLQQAVDWLIDNERSEDPLSNQNKKPFRSLSSVIEGKQGRFRQNLLGKRVDYSARSVIVVGPNLRVNQCGLPFEIIIEIFEPYIIELLIMLEIARNFKHARHILTKKNKGIAQLIEIILPNHYILLNRAPTLHRLGIQAFIPLLVSGQAIQLHPLVCGAFNADFDGDQMAVHLPISFSAQLEVKKLIQSTYNFLSPANGSLSLKPSQDMIIGCYYLTLENKYSSHLCFGHYFSNIEEVLIAFYSKKLSLNTPIWVRFNFYRLSFNPFLLVNQTKPFFLQKKISKDKIYFSNQQFQFIYNTEEKTIYNYLFRTTAGKIIFNLLINDCLNFRLKYLY